MTTTTAERTNYMTYEDLDKRWDALVDNARSNDDERFEVAVELIARLGREVDPEATAVYVETSDQEDSNTLVLSRVVIGDYEDGDGEDTLDGGSAEEERIDEICGWITWSQAKSGEAKGWHVDNAKGGYYHIDIKEALE